ncbi:hypothetical protein FHR84_003264 [Actinopolyspora biskrensis]|uniref:Uncharacterized protein n=1 Tax=Actinopolyspora biskrensis TaxID=1470178 RepID=A0A852Z3P5_9ACTN|nr:YtxH domain-containing protein [Actinopolyspora biskrensis]NYH79915.1 hypothetical protein [Actinopolyspora biskrensis]
MIRVALIGAIGYVAGTRAGHRRYEQLVHIARWVRHLLGHPAVRATAVTAWRRLVAQWQEHRPLRGSAGEERSGARAEESTAAHGAPQW